MIWHAALLVAFGLSVSLSTAALPQDQILLSGALWATSLGLLGELIRRIP